MLRRTTVVVSLIALSLLVAVPVLAAPPPGSKPDFGAHIYVDGVAWGTKATTALPAPGGAASSFDLLYVFLDQEGTALPLTEQLLVADAAPGDTDYNGGRWEVYTAQWQVAPYELTSVAEVKAAEDLGDLITTKGSFDGGPPDYFSCPLLPVLH